MNTMTATEFKAKCLEIFDQLRARKIDKLTITKRGEPVAVLTGPESEADLLRNLHGSMRGSVIIPEGSDGGSVSAAASAGPVVGGGLALMGGAVAASLARCGELRGDMI